MVYFCTAVCTRPGLDQALAAVRAGDTLVVTKLDRLARSVPDAREIADQLLAREVKLALGPTTHDPNDPMGKMFFNILATFAEFESDLIRMRTREGMAVARAKGKLRGKKPKLSVRQARELRRMYDTGDSNCRRRKKIVDADQARPRPPVAAGVHGTFGTGSSPSWLPNSDVDAVISFRCRVALEFPDEQPKLFPLQQSAFGFSKERSDCLFLHFVQSI